MKLQLARELERLLGKVIALVNLYEEKNSGFRDQLKDWLREGERILKKFQKPQASELAGVRASIMAAENGVYRTDLEVDRQISRRKKLLAFTALQLDQAQKTLQTLLEPIDQKRQQATEILQVILTNAGQNGLLKAHIQQFGALDTAGVALWGALVANPELSAGTRQLLAIFTFPECILLLEEVGSDWTKQLEEVRAMASRTEQRKATEEDSQLTEESQVEEDDLNPPQLVIASALINPEGKDTSNESITLWNQGDHGISLSGWTIHDQSNRKSDLEGLSIPPNAQLKVLLTSGGVRLNNTGGTLILLNSAEQEIYRVQYTQKDVKEGEETVFA